MSDQIKVEEIANLENLTEIVEQIAEIKANVESRWDSNTMFATVEDHAEYIYYQVANGKYAKQVDAIDKQQLIEHILNVIS